MMSTYCGSMTAEEFREHIKECGVCKDDAETRFDFDEDDDPITGDEEDEGEEARRTR